VIITINMVAESWMMEQDLSATAVAQRSPGFFVITLLYISIFHMLKYDQIPQ